MFLLSVGRGLGGIAQNDTEAINAEWLERGDNPGPTAQRDRRGMIALDNTYKSQQRRGRGKQSTNASTMNTERMVQLPRTQSEVRTHRLVMWSTRAGAWNIQANCVTSCVT